MIYVISNRNIRAGHTDETLFGDDFNDGGQDLIRVATAADAGGRWRLELMPEDGDVVPTRAVFEAVVADEKPCVFFIHGFNQSLAKNLKKMQELHGYDVNVVAFSWPSNPGPDFIILKRREYRRAQRNARRSVIALERTLEKFREYALEFGTDPDTGGNRPPFTLVAHSLGNFLTEHFVQNSEFDGETFMFRNVVLHQADANNPGHASWVERLVRGSRVYVTINEDDPVLDASDVINPDRIGNTARNLDARGAIYVDFTDAKGVGRDHRLWDEPASENPRIAAFFRRALHGRRAERVEGLTFNPGKNAFEMA